MFGLPSAAEADELRVAKRWALGLSANALNVGLAPTLEYWTSENFGLSASFSLFRHWSMVGLRGTYLFDTPIQIFSMPARPYAGAGVGFISYNTYLGHDSYSSGGAELFGGLLQPLSDQFSVRAELEASSYSFTQHEGYYGYNPLTVGVGIFYHFGH